MNLIKRIIAAALVCCSLFTYTACREDDGSGAIFKYDISMNPGSLDPQTANDSVSDLIISNMYMGLLKVQPDGSLAEGVAEDYVVSDDGLVYSFKLRQDIVWIDSGEFESNCTAHDFVYAFRRLFDPATRAARASEYFCIKNAERVYNGHIPDVTAVGVKATGDYELEITLEYPNPQFPVLLTKSPAMPCNEEYFIYAQGKYGLSADTTPSNGAFYINTWDYDPYSKTDNNFIILRRNYKTSELSKVYPSGLNFFIVNEGRFLSDFTSEVTSCIAVTDEQAELIDAEELTVESFSSIAVGLSFNTDYELFANADFRRALAGAVDRSVLTEELSHYSVAEGIVPYQVTMLDKSYREYADEKATPIFNAAAAEHFFSRAEDSLNKQLFMGARIILPDDTMYAAVSAVLQRWQEKFGFYCKMEVLPAEEYHSRLQSGDYEIAVVELTGGYNSPEAYLKPFTRNSSENSSGYYNQEFERLMKQAGRAVELSDSADLYVKAERLLLSDGGFVPLCYKNEYFFLGEDISDVYYNPFTKSVDFSVGKQK